MSLCFNYSNASGSGCYEPLDGGLTALGHEMVAAMNEVGILIDLTHVGDRTAADAIARSRKPVCYTHAGSRTLLDNVRNKSDEQLKSVADTGGVIGIASLPHFLPRGLDSTVKDYVLVVKHVLSVVGEDHVAMGSDLCPGQDQRFFNYAARRKGFGPVATSYDRPPVLQGFSSFADYARVLDMLSAALGARQLDKFKSENWLRVFKSVWTA